MKVFQKVEEIGVSLNFFNHHTKTNNFAFEINDQLGPESTILDGRPDGRPDGEAGNRTSYSPVEAGTGAELGNISIQSNRVLLNLAQLSCQ